MIQTLKVTRRDFVTFKEDRRTDGFVEIGVFVDPVLPKAGLILTAVISRQAGKGNKWCVYPYNGLTRRFTRKGAAYDYAVEAARASDAGKIHLTRFSVKP
jgi:hypothetical protein